MNHFDKVWIATTQFLISYDDFSFFLAFFILFSHLIFFVRIMFFLRNEHHLFLVHCIRFSGKIGLFLSIIFSLFMLMSWVLNREDLNSFFYPITFFEYLQSKQSQAFYGSIFGAFFGLILVGVVHSKWEKKFMDWYGYTFNNRDGLPDIINDQKFYRKLKPYNPLAYFNFSKARDNLFLGLDERMKPIWCSFQSFTQTHSLVIGPSRVGKGIWSGMILHQLILRGVVTVVMAPKHDSFLSGVLAIAARIRGVHLHHIRIRHTMLPNPFASCSGEDIYEILVDGLKQSDTGRESDFYRIAGRKVARILSNYWADKNPSFRDLESSIENLIDSDLAKKAQGFIERISELAHYFPPHHISNIDIKDVISKGDSIIITGDTMNTTIQTLHKIYAIRTVQIISQREFDNDHKQVTMFCDELKFLICPTLVRSFGVVLDRRLSYIAAFQTIGDLSDSTDLDPITIERSILDNSTIKLVYQQSDFSTAQWASNLSGKSIVNARSMHTQATTQGHLLPTSSTSYSEVGSNLFSTNIFQSLPKGCAVLFNGNKVAQLAYVCPIPIDKEKDKALTVMLPDNKLDDEMDLDIGRALL